MPSERKKKNIGQFYTTNAKYILEDIQFPSINNIKKIIEPFAGKGDLIEWIKNSNIELPIQSYDIEPKNINIEQRDTLKHPPDYTDSWVITNPPYLARNKSNDKTLYDLYNTNDLYKCFIISLINNNCSGGIIIIPAGFFFSPRDIDFRLRHTFMSKYKILNIKYFEESVFDDTSTTIAVVVFEKTIVQLEEQNVLWCKMPKKEEMLFNMSAKNNWIIGGYIYNLPIISKIGVRRYVIGQKLKENEQLTFMTLHALDSGTNEGRICLNYQKDYVYAAKDCSRTYATIIIKGKILSEQEQEKLCKLFNNFLEKYRKDTWSLFLPQYRESKEYARKRIPFELAYHIIHHIIDYHLDY